MSSDSKNITSFYDDTHTIFGHHKSKFLQWVCSIDHKRIGILYLIVMLGFFITAVSIALLMRLELFAPGLQITNEIAEVIGEKSGHDVFNKFFTLHGVIMIFLFIIPGVPATLGNFLVPLMLGARDVSFPKLNLFSWYLYLIGAVLALASLFIGNGSVDTGWTFYAPYSVQTQTNVVMTLTAAFILGMASIFTGINFIITIHRLRAPGMGFFDMPLFLWGIYSTAWIQVLATPAVGITLILVIFERYFGIGIFDPSKGGDPVLFEHLFWIYSHPAVYLMILPAFGIASEIIPTFCRRDIFGYKAIAVSSVLIAFIGYLVWAHHMFTTGMSDEAKILFSFLTFFVALPTGIKFLNWIATMYKAKISLQTPMIWTVGTFITFIIGGVTGVYLGALGLDYEVHDTYFVVAHFHYTMLGGVVFMMFAGFHYWYPKMTGTMYCEKLGQIAFYVIFIGFNMLWLPMFFAGINGMPRRYSDYLPESGLQVFHVISTVGSWVFAIGLIIMFYNLFRNIKKGEKASRNPWNATTLEWHISSPPLLENFKKIPYVDFNPYCYEKGKSKIGDLELDKEDK